MAPPNRFVKGLGTAAGLKAAGGPRRGWGPKAAGGSRGLGAQGPRRSSPAGAPRDAAANAKACPRRGQGRPAAAVRRLYVCPRAKARTPHFNPKRRQGLRTRRGSAASPDLLFMVPRPDGAARRLRTPPVLARCAFGLRQSLALRALKRAKLSRMSIARLAHAEVRSGEPACRRSRWASRPRAPRQKAISGWRV